MGSKSKERIAFDIGSKNIKIAIGNNKDEHLYIRHYTMIPTPKDAVVDGKIYNKSKIAEVIENHLKNNRLKVKKAVITISSGETILRTFKLPKMEEKELKEVVKYEMEQLLPEPIENYVVDFAIIDKYEHDAEDGEKIHMVNVQTAALPKNIVTDYLETFKKTGLKLEVIDIQSNSIAKLFGGRKKLIKDFDDKENIDKNIAIIDLGHQKTSITIIEFGKVFLHRVINKGGRDITDTIADTLNMDIATAEEWKQNNDYLTPETNEDVYSALQYYLQDMTMEIYQIIEYFVSRSRQKKLDRIYLIGGGAKTKDISAYFQDFMNIATILGNDYRNIEVNQKNQSFAEDLLYLCSTLGILLRKE